MKKYFTIMMMLMGSLGFMKAADLPLDFESGVFEFTDFDGGVVTIIDNPQSSGINISAKVAQMIKNAGQSWGGSYITLDNPIDFSTNKTMKMKVFSPRVGAKVLLKVENLDNGGISFEKEVETTLAGEWEELTFDYNLINVSNSYQKVVIIFDNGTMGDGSENFTFLFDDILLTAGESTSDPVTLPLDFEASNVDYDFTDFDGGAMTVIDNPQSSGINTSAKVAQMIKNAGQVWGGSWIALNDPVDFSSYKIFSMKVYSPRVGAKVLLKLENGSDGGIFVEKEAETTVANEWEELTFDFSSADVLASYQKVVIIIDNGTVGDGSANFTFLIDDIMQVTDNTSVPEGIWSAVSIYSYHNELVVSGLSEMQNGRITVYDLTGKELTSRKITGQNSRITLDRTGIYIIRISDASNLPALSKKVYVY